MEQAISQNSHKIYVVPSKSIARRLSIQLGREVKVGGVLDADNLSTELDLSLCLVPHKDNLGPQEL